MSSLKRKLTLAMGRKKKKENQNLGYTSVSSLLSPLRINKECFSIPCEELAKFLLGKLMVRQSNETILKGRIVETECYPGGEDKASHSYNGRRTLSNEAMYMEPGTAYVYKIYGMYHCFNISSLEPGGAVLIRALEPVAGINKMQILRNVSRSKEVKLLELCKGPSKLCISMNITKESCNKINLCESTELWIEHDNTYSDNFQIIDTIRIGISSAGEEWVRKPLRFYVKDNLYVSKRNKARERELAVNV